MKILQFKKLNNIILIILNKILIKNYNLLYLIKNNYNLNKYRKKLVNIVQ